MKQVIVIHGGTTFQDYDDFIDSLKTKQLHPERFVYKAMWREKLQNDLGDEYQVLLPAMPNKTNAKYEEWKLWFERLTEIIEDDVILIGHSLGAIFLAKYLSENEFDKTIRALFLVAAPYSDESIEDLTNFKITIPPTILETVTNQLVFFFGSDDPVIPLSEMAQYETALPDATYHLLPAPDHFVREDFPELLSAIKSLS